MMRVKRCGMDVRWQLQKMRTRRHNSVLRTSYDAKLIYKKFVRVLRKPGF